MRRFRKKLTQKEKEGWWRTKGVKKMKLNKKASAVEVESSTTSGGVEEGGGSNFFGCYLLTSLSPRHKGHTYIGFTVNPKRRIRQHNGEISSGACKTKKKRPWEMVLCIHGFPTSIAALQFEWAWQHPKESLAVRDAAATFKTLAGLANKIKLALTMLTLPSWHCMDLTVSFLSTKYMKHAAGCPTLPPQIQLHSCSVDELPCYSHPHSHPFHQHDPLYDIHSPSPHTSIHYDPSSLHTQTHNLQDGNDPLEEYSSSPLPTVASPDNQIDPLHHFPCPTEEQNHPFSITLYSDNDSPILKRHAQPSHQLPAHNVTAINCNNDLSTLTKEDPFPLTKEQVELFQQADPFMSDPFLLPDSVPVTGDGTKREDFTCALVNESPNKVSQSPHRTSSVTNHPSSAEEPVEVVDLLTPSSDFTIVAVTKRRRISHNNPSVIDLTRSPFFLEL